VGLWPPSCWCVHTFGLPGWLGLGWVHGWAGSQAARQRNAMQCKRSTPHRHITACPWLGPCPQFLKQFLVSAVRTEDPSEAHLFYVPVLNYMYSGGWACGRTGGRVSWRAATDDWREGELGWGGIRWAGGRGQGGKEEEGAAWMR